MEKLQAESEQDVWDGEEHNASPRPQSQWIAPAWFLLGVLIGVIGLAAFTAFLGKSNSNMEGVRAAAREGMLDAIATLEANQGQVPERGTPAPVTTSFNLRDANRLGNKNAKVTVVEFSDFQ